MTRLFTFLSILFSTTALAAPEMILECLAGQPKGGYCEGMTRVRVKRYEDGSMKATLHGASASVNTAQTWKILESSEETETLTYSGTNRDGGTFSLSVDTTEEATYTSQNRRCLNELHRNFQGVKGTLNFVAVYKPAFRPKVIETKKDLKVVCKVSE